MAIAQNKAAEKYGQFVAAIDFVTDMLGPLEKLIERMKENRAPAGAWRIASPEDLKKMLAKSRADLSALKDQAVKYETELTTREWKA
ncbi:hypothetical protein ACFFQW_34305 [Umezawaea endophytica]|uniref:Uncharacterized protein n=1 Tax=Umezawaea endophytica TaxID=1654476 RepID=A0A9X2VZ37_9PSEU|nr:hypothetical protein [Umezawaea endophytica]MCS7484403.1 hypothetical protein [Umezawaea endophytica]